MRSLMSFNIQAAIRVANQVMSDQVNRTLTDVEILVLEGAWNRLEYDQIAAQHQYATSYISQDVAPKLWKALSDALGEKVKKSNFREALKRQWEGETGTEHRQLPQLQSTQLKSSQPPPSFALITGCYVERPPIESLCYEALLQPGALIRIKAPKLMGKTLLMNRLLEQVATHYRTVNLSLELADRRTHFTNLDRFLRWLCINLSRELGMPNQVENYWDEDGMGSKVSCTTYVEDYLLADSDRPLALGLDNVDLLFPHPEVYEDFFGLLRSWYEKARSRPNWKKLRLIISHATDVYIRLNINQSPFNVGLPAELVEFTPDQVQTLATCFDLNWSLDHPNLEQVMNLVGGHPYLLEQAFSFLKSHPNTTVERFLQTSPTDTGIYGGHLRHHWLALQQQPELVDVMKVVVGSVTPVSIEPMPAYQLQSMGLVKMAETGVVPRCTLYRDYLRSHLGVS